MKKTTKKKSPRTGKVFLTATHHSDLTWKWGYSYYAEIRAKQFDQVAKWFEQYPEFHFHVEQAETLRVYFEQFPKKRAAFLKAYKRGNLTLTGGNSIPDLNMCCGESFIRNLQRGQRYYRDTFGAYTEIANLNDAFGMNFQIPQLLAQAGYKYLSPGRCANAPEEVVQARTFIWRGAGESAVTTFSNHYGIDHGSKNQSLPVCRVLSECMVKSQTDIRDSKRTGDIFALYNDEAGLFCDSLFSVNKEISKTKGRYKVEFGSLTEYCSRINEKKLLSYEGEFNPTFTGCYTTRIGVKQAIRQAENMLFAAELLGAGMRNGVDLDEAWHQLEQASFHDASCGCHHDAANVEVMQKLKFAKSAALKALKKSAPKGTTILNPSKSSGKRLVELDSDANIKIEGATMQRAGKSIFMVKDLAGAGVTPVATKKAAVPSGKKLKTSAFDTKDYAVDFSSPTPKIIDKRNRKNIFPKEGFGEIYFRHDTGSMWTEKFAHHWYGHEVQTECVESITDGPVFYEAVTAGEVLPETKPSNDGSKYSYWDAFKELRFRKIWRFYKELDYFTLKLQLHWQGDATKVFIAFPTLLDAANATATYDTPMGSTVRQPYFEVPIRVESTIKMLTPISYASAKGDWPALHWVDYCDKSVGLGVANSGTPGHQLVGGSVYVSLIRSGTSTADGGMKPQPGSFDNGDHEYEFAFRTHKSGDLQSASDLGEVLNRKPILLEKSGKNKIPSARSFLSCLPKNVMVSSLRDCSEGVILRLYENEGKNATVRLKSSLGEITVSESNLLEENWRSCPASFSLSPYQIKTVKIMPA